VRIKVTWYTAIIILSFGVQVSAQDASDLPAGSYQQSCKNCIYSQNVLQCLCPSASYNDPLHIASTHVIGGATSGLTPTTLTLDPAQAGTPIINCNGRLRYATPMPAGDYQKSCTGCSLTGGDSCNQQLQCTCSYEEKVSLFKKEKMTQQSQITLDSSKGDITNCYGNLTYGKCKK
jgi:hypothetical protein